MSDVLQTLADAEQALTALGPAPFPLPLGHLAPAVAGTFLGVETGDWVVAGPRERIGAVLRACPVERLVDPTAGARPYKLAPTTGTPGARALHAVGLALGSGRPALCFLGLASAASGAVHEAFNAAVLTGAPVLFVHLAPALSDDAPVARQTAAPLGAIAAAHGLGTTALDLPEDGAIDAVKAAVAAARSAAASNGPQLLTLSL